jgi:predicted nucleic acid-binding protein
LTFVFVDTGAWIALGSERDRYHPAARKHLASLLDRRVPLVTSNYVVAETATRLRYGEGLQSALRFRTSLQRVAATGQLRMAWIDPRLEAEGWEILRQHSSVKLSLADATSAAVARHRRIQEIFGFDRDFEALGFTVTPGR